jgi:hypothetical protein
MIVDKLTEFADSVSIAAAAGTANIGNQIDLGSVVRDVGQGQQLYLVITIENDNGVITGGTAGTVLFRLVSDSSASIATDGSATLHWQSKTFVTDDAALNDLNKGDKIVVALPMGLPAYERYLGVQAVTATTTTTEGTVSAFLSLDPAGWTTYPDAQN